MNIWSSTANLWKTNSCLGVVVWHADCKPGKWMNYNLQFWTTSIYIVAKAAAKPMNEWHFRGSISRLFKSVSKSTKHVLILKINGIWIFAPKIDHISKKWQVENIEKVAKIASNSEISQNKLTSKTNRRKKWIRY